MNLELILKNPIFASYSAHRYIAALDIAKHLNYEGFPMDNNMLKSYFSYLNKSPYIPGKKLRISKTTNKKEPPLMTAMRKKLKNFN